MPLTILLVEDDEHKADRLADFVAQEYPSARLDRCSSYQSGIRAILRVRPDVVLLDMTLPTYDRERDEGGGRPQPFGGLEIVRQLAARDISARCIVITQFESFGEGDRGVKTVSQLANELAVNNSAHFVALIVYDGASGGWMERLRVAIGSAVGGG